MKHLILTLTVVYLINKVTTFEYRDYEDEKAFNERPQYDLNNAPELFFKFIQDYNKQYKDEKDYNKHYDNFVKNLEEIISLNKESRDASFDINMFADMGEDDSEDGGFQ